MNSPPPVNPAVTVADGRQLTPEELQERQDVQQQMGLTRGQQGQPPLSPEEMRIIAECRRESAMYRGVPGSLLGGFLAYTAVQRGMLRPHATYGPGPKIAVFGIIGFFVGRFSYANECARKFLEQAPDSNIGRTIREAKEGRSRQGPGQGMESRQQINQQILQQHQQQQQQPTEVPTSASSYDELRNRSRGIAAPPPPRQNENTSGAFDLSPPASSGGDSAMDAPPSKMRRRVNKYGDEVYD